MIAIGILTYGDRLNFLQQTVDSCKCISPSAIIIACNGGAIELTRYLKKTSEEHAGIIVKLAEQNKGSASGYASIIRAFLHETSADHLLLLDDDNQLQTPEVESGFFSSALESGQAWSVFRPDRRIMRQSLAGWPAEILYPPVGSFLGFDLIFYARKLLFSQFGARLNPAPGKLMEAPYSGLIVSRTVAQSVSLPREDFFLYADDTEYTRRIVSKFGGISIIKTLVINELETSWNSGRGSNNILLRMRKSVDGFRLFYSVRNRVYLDWDLAKISLVSRIRYGFNKCLFFLLLALLTSREKCKFLRRAVFFGEMGKLGKEAAP